MHQLLFGFGSVAGGADAVAIQLYARSEVARANATRANYYQPVQLFVTIGAYTQVIDKRSLTITDVLNHAYNTATFRCWGFTPTIGQEVVIGLGSLDNRIFAGRILKLTTRLGARSANRTEYDVTCADFTWDFDHMLVWATYEAMSATDIATSLVNSFSLGFTTLHVQGDLAVVDRIAFEGTPLTQAMTRLANAIGGAWYVDYLRDVHLFITESLDANPETLSVNSAWEWRNLRHSSDIQQIRTRTYCVGGGVNLSAATLPAGLDFEMDINSDYATYFPDEAGYVRTQRQTPLVSYTGRAVNDLSISWTDEVLAYVPSGDTINYVAARNDTAAQTALAALITGDGIREHYLSDMRLSAQGAKDRADGDLEQFSSAIELLEYETRDPNTKSGKNVTVNAGGVSGVFQIQVVTIRAAEEALSRYPWRSVQATSQRYDLYQILRRIEEGGR